ncbi:MAG: geranylgeranyl reductase family protein [bacterium]
MYDIAIIGAGPAGATAARYASSKNLKVVLLDKKVNIGVPVQCGEFIPDIQELKKMFPNISNLENLFKIPEEFISNHTQFMRIFSPQKKIIEFDFKGIVLKRNIFDNFLAQEACKKGVELKLDTKVIEVKNNTLITSKGILQAKVIICANGPNSQISKKNFNWKNIKLSFCAQYQMENVEVEENVIEMYFGNIAPGGYFWIIPKGEKKANVGLGIRKKFTSQSCLKLLQKIIKNPEFSHKFKNAKINSCITGIVPFNGPLKNIVKNNLLLVGDAASQVMSSNGGGIPTAMICGRAAGEIASLHITHSLSLKEYEKRCKKECGTEFKNSSFYLKMFDLCSFSKIFLEMTIRILKSHLMKKIIMCKKLI